MGTSNMTESELEQQIGESIKRIRLLRNLDRATLCEQAGVSLNALKKLEGGTGSTTGTLVKILRALDRTEWLNLLAPAITINPLAMVKNKEVRQRAGKRRKDLGQDH